jgi:chemotaxis protein MotB
VVKYFVNFGRIEPWRLSAVGYGESRPVVANDSAENRARNRRVEIVLKTKGLGEHVE